MTDAQQRIDVYDAEGSLVAVFVFDALPVYFGEAGETVRKLVTAPHHSYDPFFSGSDYAGLRDESPTALYASVADALPYEKYTVTPIGIEFPESEEGVIY